MRERANGGNSYGNNYGYGSSESYSYGNQNSSYGYGTMDPKLQAAANYINSRRYREAINTLDQVQQRSGNVVLSEWAVRIAGIGKSDSGRGSRGTGGKYGTK